MHPNNPHLKPYDLNKLGVVNPLLKPFVFTNTHNNQTIDFANPDAVFQLNKALILHHYRLDYYALPAGYLCPAVPGRADYLCHLKSIMDETPKPTYRVLDIGTGANCIYPIIGAQHFDWKMVGVDIHETSIISARKIVKGTKNLAQKIEIRHQENNANIFVESIKEGEYFDATICNPPFHSSEADATKGTTRKRNNLAKTSSNAEQEKTLNFGGKANELWCNGGEALFVKRMIKQSYTYKKQVGVFTTLVSKKATLNKLYKQLDKAKAKHGTKIMKFGNKESRILFWSFD